MAYSEDELWEMSDEDLQKAFKEAKADEDSPDVGFEENEELILEQPDEDSDDDASLDADEEVEVDEVLEPTEDEPDGDIEKVDEEEPEEADTEKKAKEQPVQRRKYKANGKDFEFSDEEIFDKFGQVFGQAMNYTQKMQQLKPWRKTIDAIEQAKLSEDDINLAIDVLSGDKEAIAALLKRTGVDALELDTDNVNYAPKDYGRNEAELSIQEVVDEIKGDQEYAITYDVLERQWDSKSRVAFAENPELIKQLHIDVKSGMFDTIAPIANKLKVYDSGRSSDLDYYKEAARQYFAESSREEAYRSKTAEDQAKRESVAKVKTEQQQRVATKSASAKRKAAAPTAKTSGAKQAVNYLDDSDEGFEDFYKRVQNSY